MDYIAPNNFAQKAQEPLGQALWAFLNDPINIARMEAVIEVNRLPVEGISAPLLTKFKKDDFDHPTRQMVGSMIRQILTSRGYELVAEARPVRFGGLFRKNAKYKKV